MNDNISISVTLIVLISGLLGMYTHFRIARRDLRVSGTFFDYMFADNPAKSGITIGVFTSAMALLYSAGTFDQLQMNAFIEAFKNGYFYKPMLSAIALAFTTGYSCDSMINKGA
jgi:hypothetical protein